jgi:hypothetical protein
MLVPAAELAKTSAERMKGYDHKSDTYDSQANDSSFPKWRPDAQVTNHKRSRIPQDSDFFAPPPAEIGGILTAHSSLKRGEVPRTPRVRFARSFMAVVGVCLFGIVILNFVDTGAILWRLFWIAGLPIFVGWCVWTASRFEHTVTYVGTNGISRIKCRDERNRIPVVEVFCFAAASELRTGQTRHYRNFAYNGTTYQYTWSIGNGQNVYQLSGRHSSEGGNPNEGDLYWFACSAEAAWSCHVIDRILPELDTHGFVRFRLASEDFVRLANRWIELCLGGQHVTIGADEIGGIGLGNGKLTIRHKDAKPGFLGFGSSGIFTMDCSSMANIRVFFLLLEKLFGYRFERKKAKL